MQVGGEPLVNPLTGMRVKQVVQAGVKCELVSVAYAESRPWTMPCSSLHMPTF